MHGWKGIFLVVIGSVIFLWIVKAPVMSSYLTKKMGVDVSMSRISLWPSETKIYKFKVKNPRGFKTKAAFEAKEIILDYEAKKLLKDPAEIEEIAINSAFLSIEFSNPLGTKNNWTAIAEKMPKEKGKKEVVIHKLILNDLTVAISGLGLSGGSQTKKIPRLEFDEINSKKGFPTELLIKAIFQSAGIDQYIKDAFDPKNLLDQFLSPFSENREILQSASE